MNELEGESDHLC